MLQTHVIGDEIAGVRPHGGDKSIRTQLAVRKISRQAISCRLDVRHAPSR